MQTKKQTIQQVLWILKSGIQQNYFSAAGAPIHPLFCTCTVLYCICTILSYICTILYCTCTMSCRPGRSRTWDGSRLRTSRRRGPPAAAPAGSGTLQHNIHYVFCFHSLQTLGFELIQYMKSLILNRAIFLFVVCVRYLPLQNTALQNDGDNRPHFSIDPNLARRKGKRPRTAPRLEAADGLNPPIIINTRESWNPRQCVP